MRHIKIQNNVKYPEIKKKINICFLFDAVRLSALFPFDPSINNYDTRQLLYDSSNKYITWYCRKNIFIQQQ